MGYLLDLVSKARFDRRHGKLLWSCLIYTIGYLPQLPAGAASAIGMVDIHNRLLANPVGRLQLSAVTDDRGGASRLEIDAFTSTIVIVERR